MKKKEYLKYLKDCKRTIRHFRKLKLFYYAETLEQDLRVFKLFHRR